MIRGFRRTSTAGAMAFALWYPAQTPPAQGLLSKLAGLFGLPSSPSQMRGEDPRVGGDIWLVPVSSGAKTRVTTDGEYRSPVFAADGQALFALHGAALVRIDLANHGVRDIAPAPDVSRIAGIAPGEPSGLILVVEAGGRHLETFDLGSTRRTRLAHDPNNRADATVVAYLAGDARDYGNIRLTVDDQHTSFRAWKDVVVQVGEQPRVNLTNGNGVSSRQPALSPDKRLVAYVNVGRVLDQ